MTFEELNLTHAALFLNFVADLRNNDPVTYRIWFDRDWTDQAFARYAREAESERRDWRPKAGQISRTEYVLRDDQTIYGFGLLRFPLTPEIELSGGNLVFMVAPAHRGQGWGAVVLNRLLFEGARAGLARALVVCPSDHAAARRCIERNRGEPAGGEEHREKFWIRLR